MIVFLAYYTYVNSGLALSKQDLENLTNEKVSLIIDRRPLLQFVSETEYTFGDGNGSTIVKLTDFKGDRINTTCFEKILYPNKSTYVDWTLMTQHWEYGNYYMNFNLPDTIGIFDQEVRCLVGNKNLSLGKGFHMSNITKMVEKDVNELKQDVMVSVT
jgi:hypothetical protein